MNSVFDSKQTNLGRKRETEKIHEFLAREGRPEVVPIRDWIERWYNQIPPAKQPDIRGRLRSSDPHEFTEAYFELQVFAILKTMGHEVSVEPPLADGRYRPDFLARRGVESFYVDATVCGQRAGTLRATTNEADAVEKLRSALRNSEEEVHSDLWLKSEGKLNHTVSTKTIAKPFLDLLRNTVASEVRECYQSTLYQEDQPKYKAEFQCGDWTLECILRPKIQKHGVGQVWGPARTAVGDASKAIRTSLAAKARDWRKKGLPSEVFVVAISICHSQYFWNDGDEVRAIARSPTNGRDLTGTWRDEVRDIHGILFTDNVSLGNEQTTRTKLFPNPERHLPESLAPLTREHRLAMLTGFA